MPTCDITPYLGVTRRRVDQFVEHPAMGFPPAMAWRDASSSL